ncbi:MAG: bis(5'-nucleosyl)-tetraphosphatase [Thermoplasmataceae archaeon]
MHDEVSAGIIVFKRMKNLEFLFLKRMEGFLDLPKGHIEKGETEKEAALRETKEETGLSVEIIDGFKEIQEYTYRYAKERINKKVIFFLGEAILDSNVNISHEHVGYVWLDEKQYLQRLSFDSQKEIINKAIEFLSLKRSNIK